MCIYYYLLHSNVNYKSLEYTKYSMSGSEATGISVMFHVHAAWHAKFSQESVQILTYRESKTKFLVWIYEFRRLSHVYYQLKNR